MQEYLVKDDVRKYYNFLCFQQDKPQPAVQQDEQEWDKAIKEKNKFTFMTFDEYYNCNNLLYEQVIQIKDKPEHGVIKLDELKHKQIEKEFQQGNQIRDYKTGSNQLYTVKLQWQHIPGAQIFAIKPTPYDVVQGEFGTCYFLASLAALAQTPSRIYNLFVHHKKTNYETYQMTILFKGQWVKITTDDCFPFRVNQSGKLQLMSSSPVNKSIWVLLLQKAWAKLYKTYPNIVGGTPEEALHDLTGAPYQIIRPSTFSNDDYLWQYLQSCYALNYSIVCATNTNVMAGFQSRHAYTLLSVHQINYQGKTVRLLKLRNPWGSGEPDLYWGDKDPRWKKVNEYQKKRIGYDIKDDGVYFTLFNRLWNSFMSIIVSQVNDKASYIYYSCKDPKSQGCYFEINISRAGVYSLQVDRTPTRYMDAQKTKLINQQTNKQQYVNKQYEKFLEIKKAKGSQGSSYSYEPPNTTVDLVHLKNGKGIKIKGSQSEKKIQLTEQKYRLVPGTYIVKVKVDFDKDLLLFPSLEDGNVNLAIYAEYPCTITQASQKQANLFKSINSSIQMQYPSRIIKVQKLYIPEKMLQIQESEEEFIDLEFPSDNRSISGQWKFEYSLITREDQNWLNQARKVQWKKISQCMLQNKILDGEPFFNNIKVGIYGYRDQIFLKDQYFLAALAALSLNPSQIQQLFIKQHKDKSKYYSVRLLKKGKWVEISLDEQIPFIDNQPAFSRSLANELWIVLLEKAWAKLYGSYKRIQFGEVQEALHDLTGAPIVIIQQFAKNPSRKQQIWKTLLNASQLKYPIVCQLSNSFSLLKATYIEEGQKFKTIQLINLNFDPRSSLNSSSNIVMPFDEFLKKYSLITIAETINNASYVYQSKKDYLKTGCYFKIQILKLGVYSLQVDKTSKKMFSSKFWNIFKYPNASIGLSQLKDNKAEKVFEHVSAQRTTIKKLEMNPGTYIAKVYIDFIKQWEIDYEVTLAIYAEHPCTIGLASKDQAKIFEGKEEGVVWYTFKQKTLPKQSLLYEQQNIWKL